MTPASPLLIPAIISREVVPSMPLLPFQSKAKTSLHTRTKSNASSASLESVPSADELPLTFQPVVQAKDHATNEIETLAMFSTSTIQGSPNVADMKTAGHATYVLQSGAQHETLGSAAADRAHPAVVLDREGAPVTSLPDNIGTLRGVLSSGERGLGPQGTQTLERMNATTTVGGAEMEAVVGEAKGVAPEAVASTSPSHQPWYKRLGKHHKSNEDLEEEAEEADDDEQPRSTQAIDALTRVGSRQTMGANLSNIGAASGQASRGEATDKDGNPVPTEFVSNGAASITTTSSIRDQVISQHAPDPKTTNEKFHELFPSLPADDELIEDYRCALQREILLQGKLYCSAMHLSFRANILGWETSISVPWSEVTTIEKRNTGEKPLFGYFSSSHFPYFIAMVIPNAIEIATLHSTHTFASFMSRDSAYDLFVSLYNHAHPEAQRKRSASQSTGSVNGDKSEFSYTDDEGEKKKYHFKPLAHKLRNMITREESDTGSSSGPTPAQKVKADAMAGESGGHPPTEYDGEEYKNVCMDVILPTSPELAYGLMFTKKEFLTTFLTDNQGVKELKMGEWVGETTREMSYIKPLSAPMGPKETLVKLEDKNEKSDPELYYTTVTESHTPDVPSGSNFHVMTRTVITWSAGGGAHVRVTTEVEWTKVNRILKGVIERSCLDGQKTYHNDLETAIRSHIAANKAEFAVAGASENEAAPITEAPPSSFLENVASYLPSPILTLSILVIILFFSNFFTLLSMRQYARALHEARLGNPDEVASAVRRVLRGFEDANGKRASDAGLANKELEAVKRLAEGLEKQVGALRDRLSGL
ncbi:hypothetical protein P7C70_g4198, partial [Phenoliferia sp. Uapishka_3]